MHRLPASDCGMSKLNSVDAFGEICPKKLGPYDTVGFARSTGTIRCGYSQSSPKRSVGQSLGVGSKGGGADRGSKGDSVSVGVEGGGVKKGVMLPTPVIVGLGGPEDSAAGGMSDEGEATASEDEVEDDSSVDGDGCGTPSTQAGLQRSTTRVIGTQFAPLGRV